MTSVCPGVRAGDGAARWNLPAICSKLPILQGGLFAGGHQGGNPFQLSGFFLKWCLAFSKSLYAIWKSTLFVIARQKSQSTEGGHGLLAPPHIIDFTRVWPRPSQFPKATCSWKLGKRRTCQGLTLLSSPCQTDCDMDLCPKNNFTGISSYVPVFALLFPNVCNL